jgi:hypothetical protein
MRFLLSPVLAFVALAILSGACSDSQTDLVAAPPAAPLKVTPEFADLGSVTFGDRTSTVYTLENTSDQPLKIARIGPFSCQCVWADLILPARTGDAHQRRLDGKRLNLDLAPGEIAELHFTLDTGRYRKPASRKVGSIPVVFQNYPGVVLQWGADIWTPFAVAPWAVDLGSIGIRSQPVGKVLVVAHDNQKFGLEVDFEQNGWHVRSRRVSMAETDKLTYEISFAGPDFLPEGPFVEEFRMFTDLPGGPAIKVTVQGIAQPDLSFSPTRLMFDPERDRTKIQFVIVQRAAGKDLASLVYSDFAEHEMSLTAGKAAPLDDSNGVTQIFEVEFTGEAPDVTQTGSIRIPTGDEFTPVLEIPYTVLPKRADS